VTPDTSSTSHSVDERNVSGPNQATTPSLDGSDWRTVATGGDSHRVGASVTATELTVSPPDVKAGRVGFVTKLHTTFSQQDSTPNQLVLVL